MIKMIKIMCFGTFDMLHPGHIAYLEEAKKYGNYLIVVVARDETVKRERKKRPVVNEDDRLKIVNHVNIVDEAALGNVDDKLKIVEEKKPDIICLGYDQRVDEQVLHNEFLKRGLDIEIKRMKPYKEGTYKSSILKERGFLD